MCQRTLAPVAVRPARKRVRPALPGRCRDSSRRLVVRSLAGSSSGRPSAMWAVAPCIAGVAMPASSLGRLLQPQSCAVAASIPVRFLPRPPACPPFALPPAPRRAPRRLLCRPLVARFESAGASASAAARKSAPQPADDVIQSVTSSQAVCAKAQWRPLERIVVVVIVVIVVFPCLRLPAPSVFIVLSVLSSSSFLPSSSLEAKHASQAKDALPVLPAKQHTASSRRPVHPVSSSLLGFAPAGVGRSRQVRHGTMGKSDVETLVEMGYTVQPPLTASAMVSRIR